MSTLSISNLSIAHHQRLFCRDLSLNLKPGDFLGILGPNGSGKTTLLHALAGLHPLLAGDIRLDAEPLHLLPAKTLAQEMGLLLQDTMTYFPQTVADYCLDARFPHQGIFPSDKQRQHNSAMLCNTLELMQLAPKAQQTLQSLSGGERRRAAIAALLMQSPSIYLLDEPLNHLDLAHQVLVMNHFKQLSQQGAAIAMTLHDLNMAGNYCNHLLFMFADGSVMTGTRDELMTIPHLSNLYQHPIDAIKKGKQTYWLPTSPLYD